MAAFHSTTQAGFNALLASNQIVVGDFYYLSDAAPNANLFIGCTNTDGNSGAANVGSMALTGKITLGFNGQIEGGANATQIQGTDANHIGGVPCR